MAELPKKPATYEDLYSIPESMIGEIIDVELIASRRPSARHTHVASILGGELARHISSAGVDPEGG